MKKTLYTSTVLVGVFSFALVAAPVFAQTATTAAPVSSTAQTHADTAIDSRISDLTTLGGRVAQMVHITDAEKAAIAANIQTEVGNLTTLKGKIDSETGSALKADAKTITTGFRIYMLVAPQTRILAASDRGLNIASMFSQLSVKLQTRITAAQNAGSDVTALQTALADLNAKVADANTQAQAAVTGTADLAPDQGDKTVMQSNDAALTAARAAIKTVTADLKAADQDAKTIVSGLKSLNTTPASSSGTTQ